MDCPVCKDSAMVTFELGQVEVDSCVDCGGIWLDSGELELLMDDADKAEKLLKSFEISHNCVEKRRKCPICLKKMDKILVPSQQNAGKTTDKPARIIIDKCPANHGLWFDKGELPDVIRAGKLDEEGRIFKLLGEIFADEQD